MRTKIRLANPARRDEILVEEALVDAGARRTTLPRSLADELGLDIVGQATVRTAAGTQTLDQSFVWLEIEGKGLVSDVFICDGYDSLLIARTTLTGMGFAVDPVNERLVESELLLL